MNFHKSSFLILIWTISPWHGFAQTQRSTHDIKNRPLEVPETSIQDIRIKDIRVQDIRVEKIEVPEIKFVDKKTRTNSISNTIPNTNQRKTNPFPYPNTSNSGELIQGQTVESPQGGSAGEGPNSASKTPVQAPVQSETRKLDLESEEELEAKKGPVEGKESEFEKKAIESQTVEGP